MGLRALKVPKSVADAKEERCIAERRHDARTLRSRNALPTLGHAKRGMQPRGRGATDADTVAPFREVEREPRRATRGSVAQPGRAHVVRGLVGVDR